MIVGLPAFVRHDIEGRLPVGVEVRFFDSVEDNFEGAPHVDVAWFDHRAQQRTMNVFAKADRLRWTHVIGAGIEHLPLDTLRANNVRLTNGAGINASVVAEYAVMGVLVGAKRFDEVVRAHDRAEWLPDSPGKIELEGARALVVGLGHIGAKIADRLRAFEMRVDAVRNTPRPGDGTMGPHEWQDKAGDYDFIVIAAPSTDETRALVDAAVIARMKPTAWLVNIARGPLIDREPLIEALREGRIGGAFLDVTDPEPLTPDDPLWKAPNAIVTMHLSGRAQTGLFRRAADLFLRNLNAFLEGRPLENEIDLSKGY
ncbi:D-2-hydroxyacid dehydrogenase [Sphingomonas montanisoli]|uniref:D-2-hydroxyacid dehydrogenase n=1 Tax=Sphingomonas montanisoli TaxID=2606412 RepID=A0A5D9CA39_9SPHN|nr:D-2-hydroxyacid dehydrogenase [Sphingomonas montanisoli]